MHSCLICIGSNYNRQENLSLARRRLAALFPSIRFAEEEETKPLFFHNPALFSNQVAIFCSVYSRERVVEVLKKIEFEAGRLLSDKAQEKVCLDIDLLMYDRMVQKPEDIQREYVKRGIEELSIQIH